MAGSRSLGSLTLDLIANIGGFTQAMSKASRETQKRLDEIEHHISGFSENVTHLLEFAGVAISVDALIDKLGESIRAMDEMGKSAMKVGLPVEQFSQLAAAAQLSNVNVDTLEQTLARLAKSQGQALDGTSQQAKIFKALGINVKDANGNLRASDKVLEDFADRFKELGVNTSTTAAGVALFGNRFQDIIPFLLQGADGIKAAKDEAAELGLTLSGDAAKAAAQFEDNLSKIKMAGTALFGQVAQQLLPMLNDWTGDVVDLAKDHDQLNGVVQTTADTLKSLALVGMVLASAFDVIKASIKSVTAEGAAAVDQAQGVGKLIAHAVSGGKLGGGSFKEIWDGMVNAGNAAADVTQDAWDQALKEITARSDRMGKVLDSIGTTAKTTGKAIDEAANGKGTGGNAARLKALQEALNPQSVQQAEKLASALGALSEAVAKVNESANPTDKAYNTYADTVRNLDQLGAKAIQAGASVKYVQELVAKGVEGAQSKLAQDLDAPIQAAQAYKDALEAQLDAQKQANAQAVAAVGLGDKQARQQAELAKVTEDGAQAIAKFVRQHAAQIAANDPLYSQELADLKDYWKQVYDITVQGQQDVDAAQADWLNGIKGGYQDWLAEANDVAGAWRQITKGMMETATDDFAAFLDGSKSAKDAFNDFIDSTEAAITKFVAQQLLKKLMQAIFGDGSQGGGGGNYSWVGEAIGAIFGGGKASGGRVDAGAMYRVNENGPELLTVGGRDYLMMGGQGGSVTPNHQLPRSAPTVNNNFYMAAPTSTRTQAQVANKAAYEMRRAARLA